MGRRRFTPTITTGDKPTSAALFHFYQPTSTLFLPSQLKPVTGRFLSSDNHSARSLPKRAKLHRRRQGRRYFSIARCRTDAKETAFHWKPFGSQGNLRIFWNTPNFWNTLWMLVYPSVWEQTLTEISTVKLLVSDSTRHILGERSTVFIVVDKYFLKVV